MVGGINWCRIIAPAIQGLQQCSCIACFWQTTRKWHQKQAESLLLPQVRKSTFSDTITLYPYNQWQVLYSCPSLSPPAKNRANRQHTSCWLLFLGKGERVLRFNKSSVSGAYCWFFWLPVKHSIQSARTSPLRKDSQSGRGSQARNNRRIRSGFWAADTN